MMGTKSPYLRVSLSSVRPHTQCMTHSQRKKWSQHLQRTDDCRIPQSNRFKRREREGRDRKARVSDLHVAGEILAVVVAAVNFISLPALLSVQARAVRLVLWVVRRGQRGAVIAPALWESTAHSAESGKSERTSNRHTSVHHVCLFCVGVHTILSTNQQ